jgi:hypothetical protein
VPRGVGLGLTSSVSGFLGGLKWMLYDRPDAGWIRLAKSSRGRYATLPCAITALLCRTNEIE